MSDFVTRLVQRQLGEIKTVEPRLPDRYAAVSPSKASHSFEVLPGQSMASAAFESPTPRPAPENLVDSAVLQRRISEEPVGPAMSQWPAVATTSQKSEEAQHGPHRVQLEVRSETGATAREPMQQHEVSATRFTSENTQRETRPTLVQPLVPAAPTARLSAPFRLQSSRDRIAPMQSRYGQPDTEPPVHVTIGRIEVTALTQPAQTKRTPAARKPSMSLEDYLARRQRRES